MGSNGRNSLEAKIMGVKECDKNTNFFHKMVIAHKRRNFLVKIKIKVTWVVKEREIKDGVV